MGLKTVTANLNGGDNKTVNTDLIYKIYGNADNYAAPIHTSGSHTSDVDVTVTGDSVAVANVEMGANTHFKITAVDEAGNEGVKSDAFSLGFAIDIRAANSEGIVIPIPISANSHIKVKIKEFKSIVNSKYILSNQLSTTTNGGVHFVTTATADLINAKTRDDTAGQTINAFDADDGSVLELVFTNGTDVEYLVDGVSKGTDVLSNFDLTPGNDLVIGAYNAAGSLGVDILLDSFEIDGEVFACNEGSGITVTGDQGTVCTFINTPLWVAN